MTMLERVQGFIASKQPGAIAITGKWGQGKTHFWKKVARDNAPAAYEVRPNYAYVSLFGLNSLSDLRAALALRIRPVGLIDEDTFAALLDLDDEAKGLRRIWLAIQSAFKNRKDPEWRLRAKQRATDMGKGVADSASSASVGVSHISNLSPFYRAYAYSKVRNALICLDDLERRGSGLMLKDVMGLISQLVTERGCSVVVILNDGTLEEADKVVWDAHREKVLSGELTYQTTPEICVGYVYSDDNLSYADIEARGAVLNLGLTNVRIIQRIRATCELIFASINFPILDKTTQHIVKCLVLLVYTYAGQGDGAPPILEGMKNPLARASERTNNKEQKKDPSEAEQRWNAQLSNYNFHFFGEMDELLKDAVENGYPDVEALRSAVRDYDNAMAADELDEQFTAAWEMFHGSFLDNGNSVVDQMSNAFHAHMANVSSNNADSAIRLMRAFDQSDLADRMVNEWVDARRELRWKELGPREIEIFQPIKDAAFKKAIVEAYKRAEVQNLPTFNEVMARLSPDRYVSDEDLEALCSEPVEGYVEYFHSHRGRSLGTIGMRLLTFDRQADPKRSQMVRDKARHAIEVLARENQANAVRVEWKFGDLLARRPADAGADADD